MTPGTLGSRVERALKWSALTTVARFALQLGAQVALARILGPGNFGVYGIGMAVLTFAAFLSGASFSWNLMLVPSVSHDDIHFSFTWQLVAGLLSAAAIYLAAGATATFFGDPLIEGVMQWLALASLLMAATGTATCLLQRDLNFRALGLIQLAGYAVGYLGVGVPMALAGQGANALAAACVVQAAVTLVASYAVKPHPVRPLFSHAGGGAALTTGRTVFLTNVVNWLLSNLDRVVLGRVLNTHAVGLYSVAYNLAQIPNVLLVGALQPTFLAAGARLQGDRQRLSQGWLLGLACVLVLLTPASVVFALLAEDLVRLLYGPAWMESAWVLALLFLCLPAWVCWGFTTPVLWNTGRKHLEYQLQLPLLALAAPAWWLSASHGIRWAATVSAVVILARTGVIIAAALKALDLRWSAIAPYLARGLFLSALCAVAVRAGQHGVAGLAVPGASLFAGSLGASAAMLLVLAVRPQVLGPETLRALARIFPAFRVRWALPASPAEAEGPTR
ncbi:MAG TPA: oligosaccharide flippase family protein [Ramlibacter sp.]|nr:oligosaccharide flippase family protein [Ramlibacter sp.]